MSLFVVINVCTFQMHYVVIIVFYLYTIISIVFVFLIKVRRSNPRISSPTRPPNRCSSSCT